MNIFEIIKLIIKQKRIIIWIKMIKIKLNFFVKFVKEVLILNFRLINIVEQNGISNRYLLLFNLNLNKY